MNQTRHSFVHDIQIAAPCQADWAKMTGDQRTRFCQQCKLNVYNISQMTIKEAEALIISQEGKVCVRMYRRPDGTVITRDCPVGLAAVRRRIATIYGGIGAVLSIALYWMCTGRLPAAQDLGLDGQTRQTRQTRQRFAIQGDVQGKVAAPRNGTRGTDEQPLLGAPDS